MRIMRAQKKKIEKIQGQSAVTSEKQRLLGNIFKIQYSIVSNVLRKYHGDSKAIHLDINAGSGKDSDGNHGSPLVFLDVLKNIKMYSAVQCFFVEQNKILHSQLEKAVNEHVTAIKYICKPKILMGDNKVVLPEIASLCTPENDSWAPYFGTLYHDPNGRLDVDLIVKFSELKQFERVDILINVNTVIIKRLLRCNGKGMEKHTHNLTQIIKKINRKQFIIRTPLQAKNKKGTWGFCFLLCSNWVNYPTWEKEKFFYLDSKEGQAILFSVNYTAKQKQEMNDVQSIEYKHIFDRLMNENTGQLGLL